MGSLAPWLQLQGAQEDVGEKEESEVRVGVRDSLPWGHSSRWAALASGFPQLLAPLTASAPTVTALAAALSLWFP